jgi:hypothetical protein
MTISKKCHPNKPTVVTSSKKIPAVQFIDAMQFQEAMQRSKIGTISFL